MKFKINSLYYTDAYKTGHMKMLAPGTTKLYGTWIPRSLKHAPKGIDKIVSFGQQLVWKWIHDEFEENFFYTEKRKNLENPNSSTFQNVLNMGELLELKNKALSFSKDMLLYLGMDFNGEHFEKLWDLGYLPIKVKALPEGIETNPNIPHMTFVNTVDGFAWLTLYLETIVSSLAWKPSTSATIARLYRKQAEKWVKKTDPDNLLLVDYMCHDFSARGLNPHDMISSGLGHATSFRGSDTLPVIPAARYFYNEPENEVCINSVNASEHSVSTTKIFTVGEQQMISDWLKIFPKGILSIVADTFDLWKLITEYLPNIKEEILTRDGKLVIRPDSGDPVDIICGTATKGWSDISKHFPEGEILPEYFWDYLEEDSQEDVEHGKSGPSQYTGKYIINRKYYEATVSNLSYNRYDKQYYYLDMWEKPEISFKEIVPTSEMKGVVELLWDIFGGTTNEQGYKVLDSHIGAIYGDSITPERQLEIYKRLESKGFASTNIVLGIGSFTYQYNTRDTLGFAAKGAWFEVKDMGKCNCGHTIECDCIKEYNIYKDPITDDGTKKSLKGLLKVGYVNDYGQEKPEIKVFTEQTFLQESTGLLQLIYEDGKFYNQTSLTEIRKKLNEH